MNKIINNTAFASLAADGYQSPEIMSIETISEGVLCASGELEDWFEDDLDW